MLKVFACFLFFCSIVSAALPVTQIALGRRYSCALSEGKALCWGTLPANFPKNLDQVQQLAAGKDHLCALFYSGQIQCWGDNSFKQLEVPADLKNANSIVSGAYSDFTCAISGSSNYCWGLQVEYGNVRFPKTFFNAQFISTGEDHSCAYFSDGLLKCYGAYTETSYLPHLFDVLALSSGSQHTCALTSDGVNCWGSQQYGATAVPANLVLPRQLASGRYFSCALAQSGVQCWGLNDKNQCNVPQLANPMQIAAGAAHACAATEAGIQCWGDNSYQQNDVPPELR